MERIRFVQCPNDSVLVYLGIEKTPESTEDFEAASVLVEQERRDRIVESLPGGVRWPRWAFKKGPDGTFFLSPTAWSADPENLCHGASNNRSIGAYQRAGVSADPILTTMNGSGFSAIQQDRGFKSLSSKSVLHADSAHTIGCKEGNGRLRDRFPLLRLGA